MHPEQDQIWQFWWSSGGSGGFWRSEEIEGGHPGEVRRLRGVILEGEEIKGYILGALRGIILSCEDCRG